MIALRRVAIAALVATFPLWPQLSCAATNASSAISEKNPFDPQHKAWPDPKPAVPSTPMLGTEDVQLYGIIIVGDYKRVILKPGGRLKHLAPQGAGARPFLTLAEGQSFGEYSVVDIRSQQVVFAAGDAKQTIAFAAKTDRPPPVPLPPVVQAAMVATTEAPTIVPGITPPPPPAPVMPSLPQSSAAPMPSAVPVEGGGASTSPSGATAPPGGAAASPFGGGQSGSQSGPVIQGATLAEAIAAAQAAAAAGTLPPAANPFTAFGSK